MLQQRTLRRCRCSSRHLMIASMSLLLLMFIFIIAFMPDLQMSRRTLTHSRLVVALPGEISGNATISSADVAKQLAVREAMTFAWDAYKKHAWGSDDYRPLSKAGADWLGHVGATIIDSLSTLYLMGLTDAFDAGRDWVRDSLSFEKNERVSVFESNIRLLGGLLSAFDLSGESLFLDRALDLGERLLKAFDSPSGLPYSTVNLLSGETSTGWLSGNVILAEVGTMQLEFRALSHKTGLRRFANAADRVTALLAALEKPHDGLYPLYLDIKTGAFASTTISFGAMGDSFYEYLLKQWLQTGRSEPHLRRMYDESMQAMREHLVREAGEFTFLQDLDGNQPNPKMDHLACFAAGMLALGAQDNQNGPEFALAEALARTCVAMYDLTPTGVASENVFFDGTEMKVGVATNLLRPETVESLFILWRLTHKQQYRDWGWRIFQAFNKHCRVESGGFSGLLNVLSVPASKDNAQPSYFLAETLKYLYLLFSDDSLLPLDEWVFNTEAHPLRVWQG